MLHTSFGIYYKGTGKHFVNLKCTLFKGSVHIAKNNFDKTNINLITAARYDFVLRAKILDYYQGKAL